MIIYMYTNNNNTYKCFVLDMIIRQVINACDFCQPFVTVEVGRNVSILSLLVTAKQIIITTDSCQLCYICGSYIHDSQKLCAHLMKRVEKKQPGIMSVCMLLL